MAGPFDRVPGIDHDAQLPLPVRERMAQVMLTIVRAE